MRKQAFNPYLPNYEYIPDGEPYVFNERVYVYGSHDKFDGKQFCMNNYICYSASINDLGNWQFEGEIFNKNQEPMYNDENQCLFAPDVCVGKDGRYYLFYVMNGCPNAVSVAVCDTPAGRYEFLTHIKHPDGNIFGQKKGDIFQFDPAVIYEDEKVFLYTGFCWNDKDDDDRLGCMCTELSLDMTTVVTPPTFVIPNMKRAEGTPYEGHAYFEGPSIRRINKLYYLVYSSVNTHELCYATSKYPNKDFEYGGTIVSNGDIFLNGRGWDKKVNRIGNNHGGLVQIKNDWYIFYHRHTNAHEFSRQACAEKVYIDSNNFIKQVEITSCGLNNGPLNGVGEYPSGILCYLVGENGAPSHDMRGKIDGKCPVITQEGVDREETENQYLKDMQDKWTFGYKYFDLTTTKTVELSIKGNATGNVNIFTDENKTNKIGEFKIDATSNYQNFGANISNKDISALYFEFNGHGKFDVNKIILK